MDLNAKPGNMDFVSGGSHRESTFSVVDFCGEFIASFFLSRAPHFLFPMLGAR